MIFDESKNIEKVIQYHTMSLSKQLMPSSSAMANKGVQKSTSGCVMWAKKHALVHISLN